jgi:MoaA/NifB/PqqE/SkfB family radical SAM enzyme
MPVVSEGNHRACDRDGSGPWRVSPWVHREEGRLRHPLTGRELTAGEPGYVRLRQLAASGGALENLSDTEMGLLSDGWLEPLAADHSHEFRLRYVSLETCSTCTQGCYFCPVGAAPRPTELMTTELFESIVRQLAAHRATIEGVGLSNYNEPTADRRFVDQVALLHDQRLPPAVLSNASGFTPDKVDAIVELGGLSYLGINISTLDRERYRSDRGKDHLPRVLEHLDYMKNKPVAETMALVVLGRNDRAHEREVAALTRRFAGSNFVVRPFDIMDRAGWLDIGLGPERPHRRLRGCENLGSRPLEHLHITAGGKVVFCCEDYDEVHTVGNLNHQTVDEVLASDEMARLRRWAYGLEEAPDDFICRSCLFALSD